MACTPQYLSNVLSTGATCASNVLVDATLAQCVAMRGTSGGEAHFWRMDFYPLTVPNGPEGDVRAVGFNVTDITEIMNLQADLRRIMRELQHRVQVSRLDDAPRGRRHLRVVAELADVVHQLLCLVRPVDSQALLGHLHRPRIVACGLLLARQLERLRRILRGHPRPNGA